MLDESSVTTPDDGDVFKAPILTGQNFETKATISGACGDNAPIRHQIIPEHNNTGITLYVNFNYGCITLLD